MIARITPPAPLPAARPGSPEALRRYDLLLAGFDLLDQAIAVFDAAPRLVTWNKAMLRLLDFPEDMVRVGTPFEDFVRFNLQRGEYGNGGLGPDEIERIVAERMAAVRAFQPHHVERTRPNGQVLAVRGVPIPNLGFVTLWTDITEQRRYEQLIERQNAELESRVHARTAELEAATARLDNVAAQLARSEERLRLIMDAIPALIAYVDAGERYRFANKGYAEWFGLDKDSIVGRSIAEVFGAEAYAQIKPYLDQAGTGEQVSYEYSRISASGRQVYARSAVVPEASISGGVQGFFVLSIDITEQKASQAALIQAQKMEAVGQLTGGIAHDFNNLLTIITGNLQLLQRTADPEQAPRLIGDALWAAQRGGELTHRLLAFARMQPLRPSLINLNAIVRGLTGLLARTLGPSVEVVEALDPAIPAVFADAGELERAIVNLAINARDAMPEGGRLLLQTAGAVLDDDYVEHHADVVPGPYVMLAVSDSGTGIPSEMLSRIFEPFFTTKPVGRGSGLGLSMVYGFLKQSGGHASVYSEVGKGTTFKLFFPEARQIKDASSEPAAAAGELEFEAAGRTALVVEDEERLRLVAASLLKELGFAVIEAGDGGEALRQAETAAGLDLLFTDVELPCGMNGIAVAQGVRRRHPGARVLYTTGYSAALAPGSGHVPTDAAVLVKPYARQQLIRHLRALFPVAVGGSSADAARGDSEPGAGNTGASATLT
ncbi:MAG: PAS-domain containing protein [Proteobacteria bacterium]|nr:PAS-domain containing protein [Pseudomonadota bacterium]